MVQGMPLENCRYWIFDMDGTLTLPVHDFEAIRRQIGIPSGAPILEAIAQMPRAEATRVAHRLHDLEMELAYRAQPQPEVKNVLEALVHQGRELGILTRNGREITRATLEATGLEKYFDRESVICRDTCLPKPRPDGVYHLLKRWGAAKEETVIVGDYLYDVQAGFEAGIRTVHFDCQGLFPWPEYTHHRITRLGDLKGMI